MSQKIATLLLITFSLFLSSLGQTGLSQASDIGPIVGKSNSDTVPRDIRAARNRRHNNPKGHAPSELPPGLDVDPIISEGFAALPALPVSQSDVIVQAQVSGANAFLSEDGNSVYSEFSLDVEDVLKDTSPLSVTTGSKIAVYRPGGAIQFSSGRIQRYRYHQQGFPEQQHDYVFFLKAQPATFDCFILTAYELRNGKVIPLEGREPGSTETYPFSNYVNWDASRFISTIAFLASMPA